MTMLAPHIAKWALDRQRKSNDNELRVGADEASPLPPTRKHKKPKKHDEPKVLETKGGGGYVPPPQPSPMEQAQARDWEAAQEFERQQRQEATARDLAAQQKAAQDAAWMSSKNAAYQGALSAGTNKLRGYGLESGDPYGVYDQFTNRINTANQSLQTGADYSGAFAPTILDEILGGARVGQRNKYQSAFNSGVSPYYAEDTFGATADDAILGSILDEQYNTALSDLDAAKGRGQASQAVYDRALRDLGTAKYTANTDLQNIGRGIRQSDIDAINQRRQTALDAASNWDFGTVYDPTAEAGRVKSYAGERQAGLEGELRGAVGGKEYFDVNSLIGKAAARVGNQTTPTTTAGTGALYDTFQNQAQNASTRTNEGIF